MLWFSSSAISMQLELCEFYMRFHVRISEAMPGVSPHHHHMRALNAVVKQSVSRREKICAYWGEVGVFGGCRRRWGRVGDRGVRVRQPCAGLATIIIVLIMTTIMIVNIGVMCTQHI